MLRNHRSVRRKNPRTRLPYARKLMLTTCYGFKIENNLLRLPVKPRHYMSVKLNSHTIRALSGFDDRSITLTPVSVSISYSKERVEIEPEGYVGVDRNLDNVTIASPDGTVRRFDLPKATNSQGSEDQTVWDSHGKPYWDEKALSEG